jgi:hypothetical protein
VTADLDTLLTALHRLADDLLSRRPRTRHRPQITNAELVCLAVAPILLDCPSELRFMRVPLTRRRHPFPYLPKQPGYNKRMRALVPQIVRLFNAIAFRSLTGCNIRRLRLVRLPLAVLLGLRLYLLCAPDGVPRSPSNSPRPTPPRARLALSCANASTSTATP